MKKNNFFIQMLTCYKNIFQKPVKKKKLLEIVHVISTNVDFLNKMLKSNFLKLKFWQFHNNNNKREIFYHCCWKKSFLIFPRGTDIINWSINF